MRTKLFMLVVLLIISGCGGGNSTEAVTSESSGGGAAVELGAGSGDAVSGEHIYVIVPAESTASYIVHEEFFSGALEKLGIEVGKQDIVGSTGEIEGQLALNLDDLSAARGENRFVVNLPTLATTESDRDEWLRKNGLQSLKFPIAEFVADAISGAPSTYVDGDSVTFQLVGTLTVREVAQPVTFDVNARLVGDTIQGVATTELLLTSFGIEPPNFANTLTVQDNFTIEVAFTAREE